MSRARILAVVLPLLIGATAIARPGSAQENRNKPTALIITGTVVDESGAPIAKRKVWLLGKDFSIKLDGKGMVLSPIATTDDKGAFSLSVDRALFPANDALSIAVEYNDSRGMLNWATLRDSHGIPATLQLPQDLKTLSLGKLAFKNK
jgi:hypothetical protein